MYVIIGTPAGPFSRNAASGCTTRSPPGRAYLDAGDAGGVPVDPLPAHMRAQGNVRWAVPGVRIFDGTHLPLWPDRVHGLPEGGRAGATGWRYYDETVYRAAFVLPEFGRAIWRRVEHIACVQAGGGREMEGGEECVVAWEYWVCPKAVCEVGRPGSDK